MTNDTQSPKNNLYDCSSRMTPAFEVQSSWFLSTFGKLPQTDAEIAFYRAAYKQRVAVAKTESFLTLHEAHKLQWESAVSKFIYQPKRTYQRPPQRLSKRFTTVTARKWPAHVASQLRTARPVELAVKLVRNTNVLKGSTGASKLWNARSQHCVFTQQLARKQLLGILWRRKYVLKDNALGEYYSLISDAVTSAVTKALQAINVTPSIARRVVYDTLGLVNSFVNFGTTVGSKILSITTIGTLLHSMYRTYVKICVKHSVPVVPGAGEAILTSQLEELASPRFQTENSASTAEIIKLTIPLLMTAFVGGMGLFSPDTIINYGKKAQAINAITLMSSQTTTSINKLIDALLDDSFEIQVEESQSLLKEANDLQTLSNVDFMMNPEKVNKLTTIRDRIVQHLGKRPPANTAAANTLRTVNISLGHTLTILNSRLLVLKQISSPDLKTDPLPLVFVGNENVGKSLFTQYFRSRVAAALNISPDAYNLRRNTDHYDTYRGEEFAYSDEFLMNPKDSLVSDLNAICSPVRFNAAGADIPEKKQYVNFSIMTLNSNFSFNNPPNLNTMLNGSSQKPFWDRLLVFRVTDNLRPNGTSRTSLQGMVKANFPPDFSNLKFEWFKRVENQFAPMMKRDGTNILTSAEMVTLGIFNYYTRKLEYIKRAQALTTTPQLYTDILADFYTRMRGIDGTINPLTGEAIVVPRIVQENAGEKYDPFVIRLEGSPESGKTSQLPKFLSAVETLFDMRVHHVRTMDEKPTTSTKRTIYIFDDLLLLPEDFRSYTKWFNQNHPVPHIFVIVSNQQCRAPSLWFSSLREVPDWSLDIPCQTMSGLARRLGFIGRVKTPYETVIVPSTRAMSIVLNHESYAEVNLVSGFKINEISNAIATQFKAYLAVVDYIVVINADPPLAVEYDLSVYAPDYPSLTGMLGSMSGLLQGIRNANAPDHVAKLRFKNMSDFQKIHGEHLTRFQLPEQASRADLESIAYRITSLFYRVYPGKTYKIQVGEDIFCFVGRVLFTPRTAESLSVDYIDGNVIQIEIGTRTYVFSPIQLVNMFHKADFSVFNPDQLARIKKRIELSPPLYPLHLMIAKQHYKATSLASSVVSTGLALAATLLAVGGLVWLLVKLVRWCFSTNTTEALEKVAKTGEVPVVENSSPEETLAMDHIKKLARKGDKRSIENFRINDEAYDRAYRKLAKESPADIDTNWRENSEDSETLKDIANSFELPLAIQDRISKTLVEDDSTHSKSKLLAGSDLSKLIKHSHQCTKCQTKFVHTHSMSKIDKDKTLRCVPCRSVDNAISTVPRLRSEKNNALSELARLINRNTVQFAHCCRGLMLKGRVGITVGHIFRDNYAPVLTVDDPLGKGQSLLSSVKLLKHLPEHDLAYFQIENMQIPEFKDITHRIRRDNIPDKAEFSSIYLRTTDSVEMWGGKAIHRLSYPALCSPFGGGPIRSVTRPSVFMFSTTDAPLAEQYIRAGDCGFPLISFKNSTPEIVGIHTAYCSDFGLFSSIIGLEIPAVVAENSSSIMIPCDDPMWKTTIIDEDLKKALEDVEPSSRTGTKALIIGDNYKCRIPFSNIKRSRDSGYKVPIDFENNDDHIPSAISHKDVKDPSKLWINPKTNQPDIGWTNIRHVTEHVYPTVPNPDLIEKVYGEYLTTMYTPFTAQPWSVAINGFYNPEDKRHGSLNPIKRDSSPGLLARIKFKASQKNEFFQLTSTPGFYKFAGNEKGEWLRMSCDQALTQMLATPVAFDTEFRLKHELRPRIKVEQGNTRLFALTGIVGVMCGRKLLADFISQNVRMRDRNSCQLGINPFSELTRVRADLQRALDESEGGVNAALDFEKYDKRIIPFFFTTLAKGLGKISDMSPKYWYNYLMSVRQGISYYDGTFFRLESSVFSGETGTTVIDCQMNKIAMIGVFVYRSKEIGMPESLINYDLFNRWVWAVTFGDDNQGVWHSSLFTDVNTLIKYYREVVGMVATLAGKGVEVENDTFCSRSLDLDAVPYFPKLRTASIVKMYNWLPSLTDHSAMIQVLESALLEASMWDREFYESVQRDIRKVILKYGIDRTSVPIMDYEDRRQMVWCLINQNVGLSDLRPGFFKSELNESPNILVENSNTLLTKTKPKKTTIQTSKTRSRMDLPRKIRLTYEALKPGPGAISWYNELAQQRGYTNMVITETAKMINEGHAEEPFKWNVTLVWQRSPQDAEIQFEGNGQTKRDAKTDAYGELTEHIFNKVPFDIYALDLPYITFNRVTTYCNDGLYTAVVEIETQDKDVNIVEDAVDKDRSTAIRKAYASALHIMAGMLYSDVLVENMDSLVPPKSEGTSVNPVQAGGVPPSSATGPADRPMPIMGITGMAVDRPVDAQTVANITTESQRPGIIQTTGPLMTGFYNVNTKDLLDHAYQPMDTLQTITITGSEPPGTVVLTIPYGPNKFLSRPASKWLSMHKYFEGSFHYTIHQAAVPLLKGEIICAYMTRTPAPGEVVPIDEMQKVDWNTDSVVGTNVFSFNLYDKRRNHFYRAYDEFPGDATFQADLPCIVLAVHISPENQFPEGTTAITIRVRSSLGSSSNSPMPFRAFDVDFRTLTDGSGPLPVSLPMIEALGVNDGYLLADGSSNLTSIPPVLHWGSEIQANPAEFYPPNPTANEYGQAINKTAFVYTSGITAQWVIVYSNIPDYVSYLNTTEGPPTALIWFGWSQGTYPLPPLNLNLPMVSHFHAQELLIPTGAFQTGTSFVDCPMNAYSYQVYQQGVFFVATGGTVLTSTEEVGITGDPVPLPSVLVTNDISDAVPMTQLPFSSVRMAFSPTEPFNVTTYTDSRWTVPPMNTFQTTMQIIGGFIGATDLIDFLITTTDTGELIANARHSLASRVTTFRTGSASSPYYVNNITLANMTASSFRIGSVVTPVPITPLTLFTPRFSARLSDRILTPLRKQILTDNMDGLIGGMLGGVGQALGGAQQHKWNMEMARNQFEQQSKENRAYQENQQRMQERSFTHDMRKLDDEQEHEKTMFQKARMHEMATRAGMQRTNRLY